MGTRDLRQWIWIWVLACVAGVAQGQALRSPWDGVAVVTNEKPYVCPAAPDFVKTLDPGSYYVDSQASVTDPAKAAAYAAAVAAPTHLGQYVSKAADAYRDHGNVNGARCVYRLLGAAAAAAAWTGKMPDYSGVYVQNWELSGAGMAYLKVRESGVGTVAEDAAIRRWMGLLAARVRVFFDWQMVQPGVFSMNNHVNWAALSVAVDGVVNDDRDAFDWGVRAFRSTVAEVRPDGSLPAEMARGKMALHYHLFALGPLVMIAELGAANGMNLYAVNAGGIGRLVGFCVAGLKDPERVEKLAGAVQVVPEPLGGLDVGWGVPYGRRFPDSALAEQMKRAEWMGLWMWGGSPPPG